MTNLTLSVDEEVLKRARIRAIEQGTSVNALVRRHLEDLGGKGEEADAVNTFLNIAKKSKASSGKKGRAWHRDGLHER